MEGSPGSGPEQQAAIRSTLAKISSLHQAPSLEAGELLGQFEQLDLLGVTGHPAIEAALKADGKIPEVEDRVRANLEVARSTGSRQEIERFQRLGVLLGVEEPPVAVPEAEDGEMAGLREEAEELTGQAVQRGLTPRQAFDRFVPEPKAPAEDLSMLSLSQLRERAASLTPQQLSQIPPYKLYSMIDDELLTVQQVAGLPEAPSAKATINQLVQSNLNFDEMYDLLRKKDGSLELDIKDLPKMAVEAARETFQAFMQVNPRAQSQKIAAYSLIYWPESLELQWQKYLKDTSRPVVGGLTRITARKPALNQEEISRLKNLTTMASAARLVYSEETHCEWLSEEENYLAGTGSLREATIKWNMLDLENNLAKDPSAFPLLANYVRGLKEGKASEAAYQSAIAETEKPSLENLFSRYREVLQILRDSNLPFNVRQYNRQFLSSLEEQIADAIGPEIFGIVLDTPRSEEAARRLHGIEYDLVFAILKLPDEGIESKLFPHSSSLQASCRKVRDTYRALSQYFTTVDEQKQAGDRLNQAWEGFLAEISSQKGVDRYGTEQRLTAENVNNEQKFVSLLQDVASAEELSGAFRQWKRVAHHASSGRVDIYKASISVSLNALQRAGVNLEPAVSEKIEALNKFGIQLEPAGEPEVEKRVVEISPIDLLRAGYSPVVGELREMLEGITSEQVASLVRSYPLTVLEFNESLPATPEVRGTIIRWLMGLTPDRIEPYLRQNPLSVLNMAGWMLERHDLQPVTRNMITNTIAYLSPDTIARELNKKPMAVFDMKAETAFGPYLTVPSANSIKTHMRSITPAQVRKYFEANPKAILSFDAGMLPYYTSEVQVVIKKEAGKITYVRT